MYNNVFNETRYQILNIRKTASCVWLKTSLTFEFYTIGDALYKDDIHLPNVISYCNTLLLAAALCMPVFWY